MVNKIRTADEAVSGIKDGMTIMVGGFLGTGSPEVLMDALVRTGVKHLTVIGNDGGLPAGTYGAKTSRGIAKLIDAGMVDHSVATHIGLNPAIGEAMAVMMVSGNVANMPSLFESVRFLTSAVASEMSYSSGLQREALFSIALVLFFFILLITASLNFFLKRGKEA